MSVDVVIYGSSIFNGIQSETLRNHLINQVCVIVISSELLLHK
jgi:hypothetical protein